MADNIIPLHRGFKVYEQRKPEPVVEEFEPEAIHIGLLEAIGDFLTDPRFMVGFYVGTMLACVAAWLVAF